MGRARIRLLMVDDSPRFRDRLKRHLEAAGNIEVVGEAADGDAALAALAGCRPDVMVLDLHMPTLDGFAVLREMRARGHSAKVVVLTNDSSAAVEAHCAALGADRVVAKVDAADALVAAVRDVHGTVPP